MRRLNLVQISTIVYFIMALVGVAVMYFWRGGLWTAVGLPESMLGLGRLALIAGLGAGMLLILGYFFEIVFPSYRLLKQAVKVVFGPVHWVTGLYLAALSAIGEEVFFRGAIQPFVGLGITALFFGLLHVSPDGGPSAWSLWATAAGFLLGWMYEETGSILPPVLCHFFINSISITLLRREFGIERASAQRAKELPSEDSRGVTRE